ncbi:Zn-dependent hydrolase [Cloacibacillus sp. An23]|uniref:Zn-dependent hydrolase n=1 Tax=Cloacibacillus sp. An23 TaxID=1965591 RepID=UPI000B390AF0|nr:Zn-dependent hydrolase [Cloacibacillus sp. An23]OUO93503.1 Zn-dependent hydrolase [Cloacibacillus sp. An23]
MNCVNDILRSIGKAGRNEDGSYTRACYSAEYFAAVDITEKLMREYGMETSRDAAGNLHGVLPGTEPGLKSIIIGSHLDTVPEGGLFDGAYGVAGGLEVVRRLKEEGRRPRHTIELYGFNAEESSPLGGTFGSRAVTGLVSPEQPGLAEALKSYGHTVEEIMGCRRDFSDAKCYLELHIEQGDYLFSEGQKIGVVSGIVGVIRYKVTALGHSNHAGTTMMKNRRDAMVAMARLITEADRRCRAIDDRLVLTVGTIKCWPGSENVIPGKVECSFEMRHMDKAKTDELIREIREIAENIATVEFEIVNMIDKGAVSCDAHLMDVICEAAEEAGESHVVMPSGAGHDANPMAHRVPIGMIFVPSKDGMSHCPEEWTDSEETAAGAEVLYRTVLALDAED